MKTIKVYMYESTWQDGAQFEGDNLTDVYGTKEVALEHMNADKKEVLDSFKTYYGENDIEIDESENSVEIYVDTDEYYDSWTGVIGEKEIEIPE